MLVGDVNIEYSRSSGYVRLDRLMQGYTGKASAMQGRRVYRDRTHGVSWTLHQRHPLCCAEAGLSGVLSHLGGRGGGVGREPAGLGWGNASAALMSLLVDVCSSRAHADRQTVEHSLQLAAHMAQEKDVTRGFKATRIWNSGESTDTGKFGI